MAYMKIKSYTFHLYPEESSSMANIQTAIDTGIIEAYNDLYSPVTSIDSIDVDFIYGFDVKWEQDELSTTGRALSLTITAHDNGVGQELPTGIMRRIKIDRISYFNFSTASLVAANEGTLESSLVTYGDNENLILKDVKAAASFGPITYHTEFGYIFTGWGDAPCSYNINTATYGSGGTSLDPLRIQVAFHHHNEQAMSATGATQEIKRFNGAISEDLNSKFTVPDNSAGGWNLLTIVDDAFHTQFVWKSESPATEEVFTLTILQWYAILT